MEIPKAELKIMDRDTRYDFHCGMIIYYEILPQYLVGDMLEKCYQELHTVIVDFGRLEQEAQADDDQKLIEKAVKEAYQRAL